MAPKFGNAFAQQRERELLGITEPLSVAYPTDAPPSPMTTMDMFLNPELMYPKQEEPHGQEPHGQEPARLAASKTQGKPGIERSRKWFGRRKRDGPFSRHRNQAEKDVTRKEIEPWPTADFSGQYGRESGAWNQSATRPRFVTNPWEDEQPLIHRPRLVTNPWEEREPHAHPGRSVTNHWECNQVYNNRPHAATDRREEERCGQGSNSPSYYDIGQHLAASTSPSQYGPWNLRPETRPIPNQSAYGTASTETGPIMTASHKRWGDKHFPENNAILLSGIVADPTSLGYHENIGRARVVHPPSIMSVAGQIGLASPGRNLHFQHNHSANTSGGWQFNSSEQRFIPSVILNESIVLSRPRVIDGHPDFEIVPAVEKTQAEQRCQAAEVESRYNFGAHRQSKSVSKLDIGINSYTSPLKARRAPPRSSSDSRFEYSNSVPANRHNEIIDRKRQIHKQSDSGDRNPTYPLLSPTAEPFEPGLAPFPKKAEKVEIKTRSSPHLPTSRVLAAYIGKIPEMPSESENEASMASTLYEAVPRAPTLQEQITLGFSAIHARFDTLQNQVNSVEQRLYFLEENLKHTDKLVGNLSRDLSKVTADVNHLVAQTRRAGVHRGPAPPTMRSALVGMPPHVPVPQEGDQEEVAPVANKRVKHGHSREKGREELREEVQGKNGEGKEREGEVLYRKPSSGERMKEWFARVSNE